jgi:hypothetical protein
MTCRQMQEQHARDSRVHRAALGGGHAEAHANRGRVVLVRQLPAGVFTQVGSSGRGGGRAL